MGLADDRKPVNLMTVHVSKSVTVHEVSNIMNRKKVLTVEYRRLVYKLFFHNISNVMNPIWSFFIFNFYNIRMVI